ncbi:hypothetical protein Tco_0988714 [Tanacetum coccineum]|uniref:Uncharacterized protein n=1 Tax=Tanacetum coccineum TaxID=301880 RepID=A0ABQ5ERT3_9ASTR
MMKVILGKGKGVVIKESGEDYEVNEASNTGNRGKLLFLDENDVETKTEASTSKVSPLVEGSNDSIFGFSVPDTNDHPSWSFESMNVKVKKFVGVMYHTDDDASISEIEGDLETWNDDNDVLPQKDPVGWQQDAYHEDDEAEETKKLFAELDQLLEHRMWMMRRFQRLRKRKRENEDESASGNVLFERPNKRKMLNSIKKAMEDYGLGFRV